jgi:hypothetical protein
MTYSNRRQFLAGTGAALAVGTAVGAAAARSVSIIVEPSDPIASTGPVSWAIAELRDALATRKVAATLRDRVAQAPSGELCIVAASSERPLAVDILRNAGAAIPAVSEALGVIPGKAAGKPVLLACGRDSAGLVYALLDLADRVRNGSDPITALSIRKPVIERPANVIRSVTRLFTSDIEDKPWYNDHEMWPRYLSMLATQRFNRFNLSLGIGYDFLQNVTDGYFLFAYPFLLSVPGYNVRVPELPDAERDHNLQMLKFISEQTVARGMQFQLGIWMHGYKWLNSPHPNYTITGLSPETHGPYCREAVCALLKACPAISGVTFRVHGESGVEEGSYDFWKTVFAGVAKCGRKIEIDMHAKGMDQTMTDLALASGMPVKISPKYWAEHLGMPYHQADIRELERPKPGREGSGLMKLSSGSRSFLRYGYGDLLREDRRYGVLHRIWPGTQRLLLWGDPLTAAAHSRAFSFCGSDGVEIMEPLSFKGRRGSGIAGGGCAYADQSLAPRWDWQKYSYGFRVWGRLLYNPASEPDVWQREMRKQFGGAAQAAEAALANASRILPVITSAHGASAGNNTYWPEVYTNQPIVDANRRHPYGDSPAPKVFGNVSPLDPQLFSRINDFAAQLLEGTRDGKYSPLEIAQWLEDYADAATNHWKQAEARADNKSAVEFRRLAADVYIQAGLGRFFGAKLRSGVLYGIHEHSADRVALEEALKLYRRARNTWAEFADYAKKIYLPDITAGEREHLRGHWLDRLPTIDADIADMAKRLEQSKAGEPRQDRVQAAIQEARGRPLRATAPCRHVPAARFAPGSALNLVLDAAGQESVRSVRLHYRHVNHAERWRAEDMQRKDNRFEAAIPADYTRSPFPLQYYFELRTSPNAAWLFPGLGATLSEQPYFVVRGIRA